ncbi:hypothetical protein D8X55_01380 [Malacoplasma penetrans]|uniref:Uncharacterized protein n=1 Tax=Malacoplasma penetrans (strain HF-2) TaxID=272633 RepID=Q8EUL4_MALP2|nr:hypothetical protein [Malacoplasma penetrans]RXY97111.1 hypothetical protein D8X55_01380 [Malacoplasma penetrans]BAC44698.1 hypothetical protein [Malacoplasma penetrans HF-2]
MDINLYLNHKDNYTDFDKNLNQHQYQEIFNNQKLFKKINKILKSTNALAWVYIVLYSLASGLMLVSTAIFIILALKAGFLYKYWNLEPTLLEANIAMTSLIIMIDDIILFYIIPNAILMIVLTIKISRLKKYFPHYDKYFKWSLIGIFFSPYSIICTVKIVVLIKKDLANLRNF